MITTKELTKKFGEVYALNNVSCNIPEGGIYGIVGSNGAGKSTFLRLITGIYKPDYGEIYVDGDPVFENINAKEKFIFVSDDQYFLPGTSIEKTAQFYKSIYKNFDKEMFFELAEKLELDKTRRIDKFSKGMKRQTAIIAALAAKPKYLIFDETFDGLDPVARTKIKRIIYDEIVSRGATAIITSHSLRELEDTCDQLALLHKGGLVLERELSELKTSLFKVQIALSYEYGKEDFKDIKIIEFNKKGSVANMIVEGEREEVTEKLSKLAPTILDLLPLSLEEIFTYEMSALGYYLSDEKEAGENA